jgi:soluble lytic murein transglycosylase
VRKAKRPSAEAIYSPIQQEISTDVRYRAMALVGLISAASVLALAASRGNAATANLVPAPSAKLVVPATAGRAAPKPLLEESGAAREADHVAQFDAAIAPVRDHTVTAEDAQRIRAAVAAYAAKDVGKARLAHSAIEDPVARKLLEWIRLRSGLGEPQEYRAFLENNPAWPERWLLTQRYEEALFLQVGSSQGVKEAFAAAEPRTAAGLAALASILLAEGDEARAKTLAQRAWRENNLPASLEGPFLDRFARFLSEADHKWRLDRLLMDELRWTSEREARAASARRIVPLLSTPEQKKAEARIAVLLGKKSAPKLMAALPADTTADWGLAFQRVQLLRQQKKSEEAWKILLTAPLDPSEIVSPDAWWIQRRAAAYEALQAGKPRIAFDLVRDAGPLSTNPRNDQTFFAGFLALRHLQDARTAETFFRAALAGADGPLGRSRALYWLGRTLDALGDQSSAQGHYTEAARYADTFHGQLARERLLVAPEPLRISPPSPPSPEQVARFNTLDAAQAAVIAAKADLDRSLVRSFLLHLQRYFDSEPEVAMVAHLAEALGDTQTAVRIGKAAIARGMNLITYAYPIHAFPAYTPLREPPETALLLGLARQESEFNQGIVSGAGARGILQVMPVTARHVCRDYKIKCDLARLMREPAYNVMLASAYVGDRMSDVNGSYVLTLTSYNAGPGRTRQWLQQFGDPREASVDPVDWIFRIPFEETRDYVQKVLSNLQIYRARLGAVQGTGIMSDLARARRDPAGRGLPR